MISVVLNVVLERFVAPRVFTERLFTFDISPPFIFRLFALRSPSIFTFPVYCIPHAPPGNQKR
jgi:hypothetical protein